MCCATGFDLKKVAEVFPAPESPGGWSEGRTGPPMMSSYQP